MMTSMHCFLFASSSRRTFSCPRCHQTLLADFLPGDRTCLSDHDQKNVNAISPDVNILLGGEVTLDPFFVFLTPFLFEFDDDFRTQPLRLFTYQSLSCL